MHIYIHIYTYIYIHIHIYTYTLIDALYIDSLSCNHIRAYPYINQKKNEITYI